MATQEENSMVIPSDKPIALILGSTSGIGFALVTNLLEGKDATFISKDCLVIATARDPKSPSLLELKTKYPERLFIESVDVQDDDSIEKFITTITTKYPRLDLYIHNAGIVLDAKFDKAYVKIDKAKYIESHVVNVLAPQHIFFGLAPLLNKTHKMLGGVIGQRPKPKSLTEPKMDTTTHVRVAIISSIMGSMALHTFYNVPIYRTTKGSVNHFFRDIAIRFPHLGAFILHPGFVKTSMTEGTGEITAEESAQGIFSVLSKEGYSINSAKEIMSYDGFHLPF